MGTVYDLFLQALNASLKNEKVTWEQEMSPEEFVKRYNEMIKEDSKKHVEPMEPHEHI